MAQKVIILGGGVAGMSAAHELMERGFTVEVYERHPHCAGGKARSVNVPNTNLLHPDKYLPGEHGFRFFPGFYRHVTDTMKRIPYTGADGVPNKQGVFDNLVKVTRSEIARFDKAPIKMLVNFPESWADVEEILHGMHADTGLTKEEKRLFARKLWQLMASCGDRRTNEYERIGWWQFMDADGQSEAYQNLLVKGLTRTLVAANAKYASTKTGGDIFLQLIFNIANPFQHTDRVLNGPTSDVWITPWLHHLTGNGVKYTHGAVVQGLNFEDGKITGARVIIDGGAEQTVTGDYYIVATPVEVAATFITPEMLQYDTTLQGIIDLSTSVAWMNGLQFYLNDVVDVVPGHAIYADSPWALTSISQVQFWKDYELADRGNGKVKSILSIDISDWETDGILYGKPANECTREEVMKEVWAQLKKSLNYDGAEILRDDMIEDWYLDGDIHAAKSDMAHPAGDAHVKDAALVNYEPLLVNRVNTWGLRPKAYTRIGNLFLASDYVRTYTDLATMEGANEAARRAVNSIVDCSGSGAPLCELWNLHEPELLVHYRAHDQKRYDAGLPYKIHEGVLMHIAGEAIESINAMRAAAGAMGREVKGLFGKMKKLI